MELVEEFFKAIESADVEALGTRFDSLGDLINVPHPHTGARALHYAAARRMRYVFKWLMNQPGLDYLVQDREGRLPSALAYEVAVDPALGRFLVKKESEQAEARGIDIRTLLVTQPN